MKKVYETTYCGRKLTFETGEMAKQANSAVVVKYGDTVLLATVTSSKEPREGIDFFPLTVEFEERLYAIGKIPGGWRRREGRAPEGAILNARIIDRSIRPLFPKGYKNDVQAINTVLSLDHDNAVEVVGLIGTSLALAISDIPFARPIASVVVGRVNGEFVLNPTVAQDEASDLHIYMTGTSEAISMVEAGASEVSEAVVMEALKLGHAEIKRLIAFEEAIIAEIGLEKQAFTAPELCPELVEKVRTMAMPLIDSGLRTVDKHTREDKVSAARTQVLEAFATDDAQEIKDVKSILDKCTKELIRKMITNEGIRVDGRKIDEIRPISSRVGLLPRVHGSGLFTRGQTQVLSVTTLGAVGDVQILDDLGVTEKKRYMHHYNFPPFATGESRPLRGPNRRAIGHGALAEKALLPVLPDEATFPYTVRVVSEVLESNGSSSMASVCGSSLSLMDAGVPIKAPVAGLALGVITEPGKNTILSDIQGLEDFNGDMDFKVAGTEHGITAIQLDMKIQGLTMQIFADTLERARQGRLHILGEMAKTITKAKADLSPYAPRMYVTNIPVDKIKVLIGSGGKTINKIIEETGVKIDIEDDGRVYVVADDKTSGNHALTLIDQITKDVEVGEIYDGKVNRIEKYGCFVNILPGKDGLVHISELDHKRVGKTEDVVSLGETIKVKVINIDHQGKIKLSRKQALPKPVVKEAPTPIQ